MITKRPGHIKFYIKRCELIEDFIIQNFKGSEGKMYQLTRERIICEILLPDNDNISYEQMIEVNKIVKGEV